jgi:hypothetical protein
MKDLGFGLLILAGLGASLYSFVFGCRAFMLQRIPLSRKWIVRGSPAQLLGVLCIFIAFFLSAALIFAYLYARYGPFDFDD